jgi:tryptophan 2,3-dioxygenase
MAPTYGEYLRLEELLALQQGHDGSPSSDELHFIIVHQNFELWFKLVISELRAARDILDCDYVAETRIPRAVHHLRRVIETFRLMAQQWKVMETLTPLERSTAKMSMSCVVPFTGS